MTFEGGQAVETRRAVRLSPYANCVRPYGGKRAAVQAAYGFTCAGAPLGLICSHQPQNPIRYEPNELR